MPLSYFPRDPLLLCGCGELLLLPGFLSWVSLPASVVFKLQYDSAAF